jgi:hypothetical protein
MADFSRAPQALPAVKSESSPTPTGFARQLPGGRR